MNFLKSYFGPWISTSFFISGIVAWGWGAHILESNFSCLMLFSCGVGVAGTVKISFLADWMVGVFLGTVFFISGSVFLFSHFYMSAEKFKMRFVMLMFFFVASMATLIISGDLIFLIMGWDGLGLSSYLLVIYFSSTKSGNAGMLTALSNRVGDVAIIMFMGISLSEGQWSPEILGSPPQSGVPLWPLVLAGLTKSAQVPFSAWLPAAMAAPTPVSALVHSSTLVTAGVYLLIRVFFLLPPESLTFVLFVGGLTLLVASLTALQEMDLKKIVALSTLSQLGLMMMMIGAGQPEISFFHLNTHAFFKSLLFIGTGDFIHSVGGAQDLRKIDFYPSKISSITLLLFFSNMSLMGMPFLSGFYSKDFFLEFTFHSSKSMVFTMFMYMSLILTLAYSFRMIKIGVLHNSKTIPLACSSDPGFYSLRYTFILFLLTLLGGSATSWGVFSSHNFMFLVPNLKILPSMILLLGGGAMMFTNFSGIKLPPTLAPGFALMYLDLTVGQISSSANKLVVSPFNKNTELLYLNPEFFLESVGGSSSVFMKWEAWNSMFSYMGIILMMFGLLM